MTTTTLPRKPNGLLGRIADTAFPDYRGRKFRLRASETVDVRSYWDGGSRSYFAFVRASDLKTLPIPAQSAFDPQLQGADRAPVPSGFVLVEHVYFCGKDHGLTFHVNPADMPAALPVPDGAR